MPRKLLLLATTLTASLGAFTASAQSTRPPEDVKHADELFREAHRLRDAGKVHEACVDFAESERLDPALGTLLNLADCHQQEGKTATAFHEFEQAAREAREHQDPDRESFANQQVNGLAPKLSYVKVVPAPGAVVDTLTVDGVLVDRAVWTVHVALDPGPHSFVFAAQDHVSRTVEVTTGEPGVQTVVVQPLDSTGAPPPPPPQEPAPPPASPPSSGGSPLRTVGFVAGGVGIVGVGLGAIFGASAISSKNAGASHCSGKFCDAKGLSDESDAHSQATLSTVFFALGAVALGAGAYLVLTSPSAQSAQVRVAPVVLARGTGAVAEVTW